MYPSDLYPMLFMTRTVSIHFSITVSAHNLLEGPVYCNFLFLGWVTCAWIKGDVFVWCSFIIERICRTGLWCHGVSSLACLTLHAGPHQPAHHGTPYQTPISWSIAPHDLRGNGALATPYWLCQNLIAQIITESTYLAFLHPVKRSSIFPRHHILNKTRSIASPDPSSSASTMIKSNPVPPAPLPTGPEGVPLRSALKYPN